ncbi:MAG: hypothetical protein KAR17_23205, partial [Cyclobacteriaceae bacterium]|nr:hypothetical protein [Cyclobacteriaceae bacterium]
IYGRHDSIYQFPRKRPVMSAPGLPLIENGIIKFNDTFSEKYVTTIIEAKRIKPSIDKLIASLYENISKADRNKQNIEVLLSIAYLEKHFIDMVLTLESVEILLNQAGDLSQNGNSDGAIQNLQRAHLEIEALLANRTTMWNGLKTIWEKGRLPKNVNANRNPYVHVLDDVKDHVADKTLGIEYMIEPMEDMELDKWNEELEKLIAEF